jgi:hypothetical protein
VKTLKDIKVLLNGILCADNPTDLIKEFQSNIWNNQISNLHPEDEEILKTLAYDLDFYEHNQPLREEDSSYYGADRLFKEITSALEKLM